MKAKTSSSSKFELPKNVKSIVGLDLSLTHSGICILIGNTRTYFSYEPKSIGMFRLKQIKDWVITTLSPEPCPPEETLIAIEAYSFASKGQAGISLGELGGIVRLTLYEAGYKYVDVPPTVNKKFLCNKGNADKAIMLKELYKNYNIDTDDDNICDAIVLSELAACLAGKAEPKYAYQKEVIINLKKGLGIK